VLRVNENETGGKKNKYHHKTNDGKQLLRDVMRKYISEEVTRAEKQGFSSPDSSWFKGESINYVKRRLFNNQAKIYSILDRNTVHKLVNQHLQGSDNRRLLIWSLLNIEEWMEANL